jgi:hypothetical protein
MMAEKMGLQTMSLINLRMTPTPAPNSQCGLANSTDLADVFDTFSLNDDAASGHSKYDDHAGLVWDISSGGFSLCWSGLTFRGQSQEWDC